MLEYGYVIEGIGGVTLWHTVHAYLKQVAALKGVLPGMDETDGLINVAAGDIGQETQTAGVDTDHGDGLVAYTGSCAQERTVTTDAYHGIGLKVVIGYKAVIGNFQTHGACQEFQITALHGNGIAQ